MDKTDQNNFISDVVGFLELEQLFMGDTLFFNKTTHSQSSTQCHPIETLKKEVIQCQKCSLCSTRKNVVFGEGSATANLLFIGEAPGQKEDETGRPFVGRAGLLLNKMIEAMKLSRQDIFIANIIKCRPPQNRNPEQEEIKQCFPFLEQQIKMLAPKVICTLGHFAAKTLLNDTSPISRLRGNIYTFKNIPLIPTFHPAYLLRNASMKKHAWQDLQLVLKTLKKLPTQH